MHVAVTPGGGPPSPLLPLLAPLLPPSDPELEEAPELLPPLELDASSPSEPHAAKTSGIAATARTTPSREAEDLERIHEVCTHWQSQSRTL